MTKSHLIAASLFVALVSFGSAASAEGIKVANGEVTVNAGVSSDYRFRGVSQTQGSPSFTAGVEYNDKTGLYIGNQNTNVSDKLYTNGMGMESDVYAGYKTKYNGFTFDVGTMNYFYPNATNGTSSNFTTNEVYAGVGYGSVSVKGSTSLGNYFGTANSQWSKYLQADLNHPIGNGFSVLGHVGRTYVENNSRLDYTDWNAGIGYTKANWTVAAKYYTNTNKGAGFAASNTISGTKNYRDAVVLSLSTTF